MGDGADSLSRSASDSSVSHNPPQPAPGRQAGGNGAAGGGGASANGVATQGTSNSPAESGYSDSGQYESRTPSATSGDQYPIGTGPGGTTDLHPVDVDDPDDEFFDTEPLPILGRCKAMYPFEVTSEGSIRMEEGEELWLIENDQGDGWTRVRRVHPAPTDPMPEGFVPSTYIQVLEQFDTPLASAP